MLCKERGMVITFLLVEKLGTRMTRMNGYGWIFFLLRRKWDLCLVLVID